MPAASVDRRSSTGATLENGGGARDSGARQSRSSLFENAFIKEVRGGWKESKAVEIRRRRRWLKTEEIRLVVMEVMVLLSGEGWPADTRRIEAVPKIFQRRRRGRSAGHDDRRGTDGHRSGDRTEGGATRRRRLGQGGSRV